MNRVLRGAEALLVFEEIARELVTVVRRDATIDWAVKESVRVKLHIMVERVLRKHGYP